MIDKRRHDDISVRMKCSVRIIRVNVLRRRTSVADVWSGVVIVMRPYHWDRQASEDKHQAMISCARNQSERRLVRNFLETSSNVFGNEHRIDIDRHL